MTITIEPLDRIERQFQEFHRRNPHVYEILVRLCREVLDAGHKRIGIGMLWERMRWELVVKTTPTANEQDFRLNNNFRSRYSRMLMEVPEFAGLFEVRKLRSRRQKISL